MTSQIFGNRTPGMYYFLAWLGMQMFSLNWLTVDWLFNTTLLFICSSEVDQLPWDHFMIQLLICPCICFHQVHVIVSFEIRWFLLGVQSAPKKIPGWSKPVSWSVWGLLGVIENLRSEVIVLLFYNFFCDFTKLHKRCCILLRINTMYYTQGDMYPEHNSWDILHSWQETKHKD